MQERKALQSGNVEGASNDSKIEDASPEVIHTTTHEYNDKEIKPYVDGYVDRLKSAIKETKDHQNAAFDLEGMLITLRFSIRSGFISQVLNSLSSDERYDLMMQVLTAVNKKDFYLYCSDFDDYFEDEKYTEKYKSKQSAFIISIFNEILKADPTIINQQNSVGNFILCSMVMNAFDLNLVKLLIEAGVDVHQTYRNMSVLDNAKEVLSDLFPEYLNQLKQIPELKSLDNVDSSSPVVIHTSTHNYNNNEEIKQYVDRLKSAIKETKDHQNADFDLAGVFIRLRPSIQSGFLSQILNSLSSDERYDLMLQVLTAVTKKDFYSYCSDFKDYFEDEKYTEKYKSKQSAFIISIFNEILKSDPTIINQQNSAGNSILCSMATNAFDLNLVKFLIEAGVDVHQAYRNMSVLDNAIDALSESRPEYLNQLKQIPELKSLENVDSSINIIENPRYRDEVRHHLILLKEQGIWDIVIQDAMIRDSKNAAILVAALKNLNDHHLLTNENRDAVLQGGAYAVKVANALLELSKHSYLSEGDIGIEVRKMILRNAKYAEIVVGKLISNFPSGNIKAHMLEDAQALIEVSIDDEKDVARFETGNLKSSIKKFKENAKIEDRAAYSFINSLRNILKLKSSAHEILESLSNNDRFILINGLFELLRNPYPDYIFGLQEYIEDAKYTEKYGVKYAPLIISILKDLVKIDPTIINTRNAEGDFLLNIITKNKRPELVDLLIESGANVNQRLWGMTSMGYAMLLYKDSDPGYISKLNHNPALMGVDSTFKSSAGQTPLIDLAKNLGYRSDEGGVCFGHSLMGMQAFLLLDENGNAGAGLQSFTERTSRLVNVSPEKHLENLLTAKEKIKNQGSGGQVSLTEDEKIAAELPVFFEGVELYHNQGYDPFYAAGMAPASQIAEPSLELVASKQLEQQGGVASVASFSGTYNVGELHQYFADLKATVHEPVGLILSGPYNIDKGLHSIFVGFDPVRDRFVLINANDLSNPCQYCEKVEEIVEKIKIAYKSGDELDLGTTVYAASRHQASVEKQCKDWLKKLEPIHQIDSHTGDRKYSILNAKNQGESERVRDLYTARKKYFTDNKLKFFEDKENDNQKRDIDKAKTYDAQRTRKGAK